MMQVLKPTFAYGRPPKTREELWWAMRAYFGLTIPRTRVCPHHSTPFDAFCEAYFATAPVSLWIGSRGFGGKSFLLAGLTTAEATFLGARISLLGGSGAQSLNVQEHTKEMWSHDTAPRQMLLGEPTKFDTHLVNRGHIRALMASPTSVRGPHPQRLRLDEIDEMDLGILNAAKGQPMRKWGIETQTVMSSTWQHPDGTVTDQMKQAKEKGWPIHQWCIASGSLVLTGRGEVPIEEVTNKDVVLTRKGWRQVQHVTFMGYKPTISLRINQRILRCTEDHRIATVGGWMMAGAFTTDSMPSPRSDVGVLGSELVPVGAVAGSSAVQPSPPLVLGVGDGFQVLDLNTCPVPAQVVKLEVDRANDGSPDPQVSVGRGPLAVVLDAFDAVSVTFGTRPVDAISGEHRNILPVWDIGVEDEHEFVCEGVVVHNCYKETSNPIDGWLSADEVERKRLEIPKSMWESEYDLQEPSFEGRAFNTELLDLAFSIRELRRGESEYTGDEKGIIYRMPVSGRVYVTGADWAKNVDKTIVATFDATEDPWVCVAWQKMGKMPWPEMVGRAYRQWQMYGGEIVHDATGLGNVVDDILKEMAHKSLHRRIHPYVISGGQAKASLYSEYVAAVEQWQVVYPMIRFCYDEHRYCRDEDLYGSSKQGHTPDSVVAGALAWTRRGKKIVVPSSVGGTLKTSTFRGR